MFTHACICACMCVHECVSAETSILLWHKYELRVPVHACVCVCLHAHSSLSVARDVSKSHLTHQYNIGRQLWLAEGYQQAQLDCGVIYRNQPFQTVFVQQVKEIKVNDKWEFCFRLLHWFYINFRKQVSWVMLSGVSKVKYHTLNWCLTLNSVSTCQTFLDVRYMER